ncbi:MAG: glycoside hydrolase family 95-like protein [bacterium]
MNRYPSLKSRSIGFDRFRAIGTLSLALVVILHSGIKVNAASPMELKVDWPSFMSRQDPVWKRMPMDYFEGPFVGNGLLGTVIFKDDQQPNTLRYEIGRVDVYDHRTKGGQAVGRLPIGQLLLTPIGEIQKINLRTDLWNAEIRGEITTSVGTLKLRCFVPSDGQLIVLNLNSTGQENAAKCAFRPEQGNHPRVSLSKGDDVKGYVPNPTFTVTKTDGIEVVTQPLLVGDDYATAWSDVAKPDGSRTVLVSVANRWAKNRQPATGSAEDAVATIKAAQTLDLSSLEKSHRDWWHQFYSASFVSIPDARIESFYWIQLYKLASATRENRPAIDLMGPWFKKTMWASYWVNLNIQLAYYTTGITNHLDLAEPLYRLMERSKDQLVANVSPPEYRNDCAALGNPVGYDVLNAGVGLQTNPADPKSRLNLIALPWLMQMFYIHNQMSIDDTRLREGIFPLMKRAYQVYIRKLVRGADGKYRMPYAFSDEYGNAEEVSMHIGMARWGFATLIAIAERLKIDDPQIPQWKEYLANMADYNIDDNGIMIGKDAPFAKPHRHYSHLFCIFPFYSMNVDKDPERIPIMKKSVQHFTDLDGDNKMFKFTGAASLWAALGDGDQALKWLDRSLAINTPAKGQPLLGVGRNTLYSENGNPTFESPIASTRALLDMLIQSWGGTIRIFPAMPTDWKDAVFHNLRAEGGFLVSAGRKDGKTAWVRIKSLAGEPCQVRVDGKLHELKLAKGEEITLGDGQPVIAPLPMEASAQNAWGSKQ